MGVNVMTRSGYVRSRPKAEVTAALYTSRYALQTFDQGSCKRILDVGCGEAFFEQRYPHRFIGIDIDLARLSEAHQRSVSNLILGSAERLPFPDGTFDGVLLKDVLEHFCLEGAFCVLHEVSRVLKTDGTLVVTTTKNSQWFWDKPDHVRPYSNKWIRRVLVRELGQYEVIAAKELSGGIRGFGRLRLEWLAHALADRFGIRNTHGIIALKRV
jgi:ubiquinone/menaquinone biosynthesis C-methylase UbiE